MGYFYYLILHILLCAILSSNFGKHTHRIFFIYILKITGKLDGLYFSFTDIQIDKISKWILMTIDEFVF